MKKEKQNIHTCAICGRRLKDCDYCQFEAEWYCRDCLTDVTFVCDCCGERYFQDTMISDDDTEICQTCYDNCYTRCACCDSLIRTDDAHYIDGDDYCDDCYDDTFTGHIHDYTYKPNPIFYGKGPLFMGVELEIDGGGKDIDNAEALLDIANSCENSKHMYIKSDGSLCDGMELVSHPMSLKYHMDVMPWRKIMAAAIHMGYRSHKTTTCGLHVHVSRSYFGSTYNKQEQAISRVLYIVERYWFELLRFSRRTQSQISQWAVRYGYENTPVDILDKAKCNPQRYTCVNLTNQKTIEFRIFKGTLKYNTFIATLELVSLICEYAVSCTDQDLQELSWIDFVLRISKKKYPELINYLKERRLYVNEPVANEEGY